LIESVNEIEDYVDDIGLETEREDLYDTISELKDEIKEMRMAENDIDSMLHPELITSLYDIIDEFLDSLFYEDYDTAYADFNTAL
jgi:hypothetical protein